MHIWVWPSAQPWCMEVGSVCTTQLLHHHCCIRLCAVHPPSWWPQSHYVPPTAGGGAPQGGMPQGPLFMLSDGSPLHRSLFVQEVQRALSPSGFIGLNFKSQLQSGHLVWSCWCARINHQGPWSLEEHGVSAEYSPIHG